MILFSLILLLLSNSLNLSLDKCILYSRITFLILLLSVFVTFFNLYFIFLNKGIGLFGGLFHSTSITSVFHIFITFISSVILILTSFYPRKIWVKEYGYMNKLLISDFIVYYQSKILNKMGEQFKILEYSLIILFIVSGALFLISTSDLVSIFLAIELQSYGLYLLPTIYRDSEPSTSSGLMYFLLGGLSSCFILLGTSLLYANSGTTNLDNLYIITSIFNINKDNLISFLYWYKSYYIYISLLLISVGFLFKVSAAPFHFWSPDVYDSIPTIVTTFVAIIAKISIFIFLLELVHYTGKAMFDLDFSWTISLLLSSLLSLIIGTIVGLTQFRIKRLYAFSTISHVGFILLALTIDSTESIEAFMFYLMQYSISNLNAFILIITIGYSLYFYIYKIGHNKTNNKAKSKNETKSKIENMKDDGEIKKNHKDKEKIDEKNGEIINKNKINTTVNEDDSNNNLKDMNNSPIQLIDQLKGFYYINPLLSFSIAITLFSFAGIPPAIGFFGKQMILSTALDNGYIFMSLVAILTSVISAVYYLVVIKQLFFFIPDFILNPKLNNFIANGIVFEKHIIIKKIGITVKNIVMSNSLSLPISMLTLIIQLFIFIPQEWLSVVNLLTLILFL